MKTIIRSNTLRLAVLLWFSGWLLLVMPGHTRGIVELPVAESEQAALCCEPKPNCCGVADDCDPPKPSDPAKHCAICYLKSHLTDPPPLVLFTPYLGELDELTYLLEVSILDELAGPTQMRGRAPPA